MGTLKNGLSKNGFSNTSFYRNRLCKPFFTLLLSVFLVAGLPALAQTSAKPSPASPTQEDSVDINRADAESIAKSLSGIGPKLAGAIVEYREANGPFKSVEELTAVRGIGSAVIEKNRAKIRF